jgi:ArsR family transcriptional regulator
MLAGVEAGSDRRPPETLAARSAVLKAVADPTRLAVLDRLADRGQRCHCDLEVDLQVPANRLSFHLKVLRDAGLIVSSRDGKRVNYHLADDALQQVRAAVPGARQGAP